MRKKSKSEGIYVHMCVWLIALLHNRSYHNPVKHELIISGKGDTELNPVMGCDRCTCKAL